MYVLDTNVLSEIMNPEGTSIPVDWTDRVRRSELFTTAVNQAEVLYGLAIMPAGRRRADRLLWAHRMFAEDFYGRILPFDRHAAEHYAAIAAARRSLGRPIEPVDAQIAAVVRANGMAIVTRNVRDFTDCDIEVLNPWQQ